jgi:hypothetical protein
MPEDHTEQPIPLEDQVFALTHKLRLTSQLLRETNYKLKLAHRQIGKQGDTIYAQRCMVEELHTLISKEDRGVYRRIQDQYDDLYAEHQQTLEYVDTLKKKLDAAETKQ